MDRSFRRCCVCIVVLLACLTLVAAAPLQIENVLQWARNEGAIINAKVGFQHSDELGNYAYAVNTIEPEETLLDIPNKLMICASSLPAALLSLIKGNAAFENATIYARQNRLALLLMYEYNRENSFWRPFLDALPIELSHLPVYWKEDDLEFAEGTALQRYVTMRRGDYVERYEHLNTACQVDPTIVADCSDSAAYWAISTILARSFIVTDDICMIPVTDFFNHDPNAKSENFDGKTNQRLVTHERVAAGEQVFFKYGEGHSIVMLMNYGFTILDNPFDAVQFGLDSLLPNVTGFGFTLSDLSLNFTKNKFPDHMLPIARAVAMFTLGINNKSSCAAEAMRERVCVSLRIEALAMQTIADVGRDIIRGYPTTIAQDFELLQQDSAEQSKAMVTTLTRNQRNAIKLRLNEKQLVEKARIMVRDQWRVVKQTPCKCDKVWQYSGSDEILASQGAAAGNARAASPL
eukprot:TRINITY_DN4692_c0_g1_i1.p1 TRINITY_DN4692_c0_g1~~TRINITY_DN4692_c0_g1_i1.p1  ORF type:complete len:484 (-),score=93.13 TRINITY_DN4692_c0_g1_i1:50-1438(-)